jgi:hypothetical protein
VAGLVFVNRRLKPFEFLEKRMASTALLVRSENQKVDARPGDASPIPISDGTKGQDSPADPINLAEMILTNIKAQAEPLGLLSLSLSSVAVRERQQREAEEAVHALRKEGRHVIVRNIPVFAIQSGEPLGRLDVIVSQHYTFFSAIVAFAMHRSDEMQNKEGDVAYRLFWS